MSVPAPSAGSADSAAPSVLTPHRSSGSAGSSDAADSVTASASAASAASSASPSSSSALPTVSAAPLSPVSVAPAPLFASSSSSSASALPALMPSTSAADPSVTVEDELTKRCSQCAEDRPLSDYSSAQLKKKGKRVCHSCVDKRNSAQKAADAKAAAAARKESMKGAFAAKLNSSQTQTASACLCCGSKAIRFAPCARCTVECCSLRCFDLHDCDAYLEAKRTMPTELIPEEDRFHSVEEILTSWTELLSSLSKAGVRVHPKFVLDEGPSMEELLRSMNSSMPRDLRATHSLFDRLHPPRLTHAWWAHPSIRSRIDSAASRCMRSVLVDLIRRTATISAICIAVLERYAAGCLRTAEIITEAHAAGRLMSSTPPSTVEFDSACFLRCRLQHKLLTFLRWIVQSMGSAWIAANFELPGDASSPLFGTFPSAVDGDQRRLAYVRRCDRDTGLTLIPLSGVAPTRYGLLLQHFGEKRLMMIVERGLPVLDRGIVLIRDSFGSILMSAVAGWCGNISDSFARAPTQTCWLTDEVLQKELRAAIARQDRHAVDDLIDEREKRNQPGFFHIISTIKQMIPTDEWPSTSKETLFIATPQPGTESELVELSLLESIAEDAAAGNEQAQLLIAHIEEECAAPIAEVIAAQKSRLEQMLEDQAEQLRIHAEAVERTERRARIKEAAVEAAAADEEQKDDASTAAASASALAPALPAAASSASSSSVIASSSSSPSAVSSRSSSVSAPAYSWTQSREFASVASLREPGRKKYSTIMCAAKRLLYSLNPVSVNRKGGSHIVFHFAEGPPVTLVQMHAGSKSKDNTAYSTRLYEQLNTVALQQLTGGAESGAIEGAPAAGGAGGAKRLLK